MDKVKRIKELTAFLNKCSHAYYNENKEIISDFEFDKLIDELKCLEEECGTIMVNSPTQRVGYEVKSELKKVKHDHLMLSLDKTKSVSKLCRFLNYKQGIMMLKLDGLTISICYKNGLLFSAETRGNGEIGEDVTHNAKVIANIPQKIDYKGDFIIDGEAIITYKTFEEINSKLLDDDKYKNARNLASGSVRQLDSGIAAKRNIRFVAWKVISDIDGYFTNKLEFARKLGFDIVPYRKIDGSSSDVKFAMEKSIDALKEESNKLDYPIDGMVIGFNDVKYGESLGHTKHHLRSQLAYKFYDEEIETVLKDIEWTMGKTGVLTPTAVFEPVEIDGTTVNRASLHNVSIMKSLELSYGDAITVYKANMIIPQVSDNLDRTMTDICVPPEKCPICGGKTEIQKDKDREVLVCINPECSGKLLGKLTQFCSKNAMDIRGLSEESLKKFIEMGWIRSFIDIYSLIELHGNQMKNMAGFGSKSVSNLKSAIEKSKDTDLERFVYALCIPGIGRAASKTISEYFKGSFENFYSKGLYNSSFDWTKLTDFGDITDHNIKIFAKYSDADMFWKLGMMMNFKCSDKPKGKLLAGLTFVITGSFEKFANRNELKYLIESNGGKVSGSVSAKTSYLINNDITSESSKNKKAKELSVPIINETQFMEMIS